MGRRNSNSRSRSTRAVRLHCMQSVGFDVGVRGLGLDFSFGVGLHISLIEQQLLCGNRVSHSFKEEGGMNNMKRERKYTGACTGGRGVIIIVGNSTQSGLRAESCRTV